MHLLSFSTVLLGLASLASTGRIQERATYSQCSGTEGQKVQAAVTSAGEMAAKAAAAIKDKSATSLFQRFFQTTDSSSMNYVAKVLEEISLEASQQGSGLVTYSCQPDGITCQTGTWIQTGYAYTNGYTGHVSTCPGYFTFPEADDDCSALDQRTSSLHELAHTKGVFGFEVYGYENVLGLSSGTALKNAESYAFFAKSVYLGCDGTSGSGSGSSPFNWFNWWS